MGGSRISRCFSLGYAERVRKAPSVGFKKVTGCQAPACALGCGLSGDGHTDVVDVVPPRVRSGQAVTLARYSGAENSGGRCSPRG